MNDSVWLCDHPDCENMHKKDAWNTRKAQTEGWFFQKDGSAYCPAHVPEWVAEWRAKRDSKGEIDG